MYATGSGGNNTQSRCASRGRTIIEMVLSGPTNFSVEVYRGKLYDSNLATTLEECNETNKAYKQQCEGTAEAFCKNPLTIVIDLAK